MKNYTNLSVGKLTITSTLSYATGAEFASVLLDNQKIKFGTGEDVEFYFDATDLLLAPAAASVAWKIGATSHVVDTTLTGTFTVGVDDTGHDVKFFGATSGCSCLWDESEDQLVITGPADVPALKIAGAGSFSAAAYAAVGAAWADGGTPAFIADQRYLMINYAGTVYRIPVWANS